VGTQPVWILPHVCRRTVRAPRTASPAFGVATCQLANSVEWFELGGDEELICKQTNDCALGSNTVERCSARIHEAGKYPLELNSGIWPLHHWDASQIIQNGQAMVWIIHNEDVESLEEHGWKGHVTYFEYPGLMVTRDQLIVTTKQQQAYEDAHGIPGSMVTVVKRQATLAVLNATSRFLNRLSK